MLKIDILSSFLKLNYQYRKIHKMKVSVVGNRLLNKAFDIKSDEYSLYYTQLKSHFKFI
jgi:hypothetical protein